MSASSFSKPKIAVSVGDCNGIGTQILLQSHSEICEFCDPVYFVSRSVLSRAANLLRLHLPETLTFFEVREPAEFEIHPGKISGDAGFYSYDCFQKAVKEAQSSDFAGVLTLPIHKKAWNLAGIPYRGHTEFLRDFFEQEAIMMLGCPQFYVALFTEHIPLRDVPEKIQEDALIRFLLNLAKETGAQKCMVPGLNPHAGEGGVLGEEDKIVKKAVDRANEISGKEIFFGPLSPDIAFSEGCRKQSSFFAALYHDQGLIPVKTLFFEESINISLNLPILRTSVDHGTAFDKAYRHLPLSLKSYKNAALYLCQHAKK